MSEAAWLPRKLSFNFSRKFYTVPVRTFVVRFNFGSGSKSGSGTGSDPECILEKVLKGGVKRGYPREAVRTISNVFNHMQKREFKTYLTQLSQLSGVAIPTRQATCTLYSMYGHRSSLCRLAGLYGNLSEQVS
jgi:hypothetical protein